MSLKVPFGMESEGLRFRKYNKSFPFKRYKNFLIFEQKKSVSQNKRNFFGVDFFYFGVVGLIYPMLLHFPTTNNLSYITILKNQSWRKMLRRVNSSIPLNTFTLKGLSWETFAHSIKLFPTRAAFGHLFILNSSIIFKPRWTTTAIRLHWDGLKFTFHYIVFSSWKTLYVLLY